MADTGGQDGARLRSLRGKAGMSLAAAAAAAGMSKGELSKLETGARPIRPDHVVRLARVFGLPAAELLTPGNPYRELLGEVQPPEAGIPLLDRKSVV